MKKFKKKRKSEEKLWQILIQKLQIYKGEEIQRKKQRIKPKQKEI